jgi:hypothetical protein
MLPEMNCSNTHIKWSLPLLKSQPASCERQKRICSSVIVNVRVLMLTFNKNKVSLTGSFQMPMGVFVQLHWYVQCWLILVKHCSSECSHLNFCCSSVVIFEVFLNLTEVFPCFFLSCKANARVKLTKTGHGPHSMLFGCYLCCSM